MQYRQGAFAILHHKINHPQLTEQKASTLKIRHRLFQGWQSEFLDTKSIQASLGPYVSKGIQALRWFNEINSFQTQTFTTVSWRTLKIYYCRAQCHMVRFIRSGVELKESIIFIKVTAIPVLLGLETFGQDNFGDSFRPERL